MNLIMKKTLRLESAITYMRSKSKPKKKSTSRSKDKCKLSSSLDKGTLQL
jgi:hypothetical protein